MDPSALPDTGWWYSVPVGFVSPAYAGAGGSAASVPACAGGQTAQCVVQLEVPGWC